MVLIEGDKLKILKYLKVMETHYMSTELGLENTEYRNESELVKSQLTLIKVIHDGKDG